MTKSGAEQGAAYEKRHLKYLKTVEKEQAVAEQKEFERLEKAINNMTREDAFSDRLYSQISRVRLPISQERLIALFNKIRKERFVDGIGQPPVV